MAGLRASDLTAAIVEGVSKSLAKILLPKVRKMIREEIARGMEQVISETKTSSVAAPASTQAAKETIAQRQNRARERARAIVERAGRTDDPLLDMVINAEDPQEEKELMMQEQLQQPMVDSKEVQRGDVVAPENIDFNDRLEKLGIV